jgi:hypothetical protein
VSRNVTVNCGAVVDGSGLFEIAKITDLGHIANFW